MSWRDLARCKGMNTEIFFPLKSEPEAFAAAVTVCSQCEVRDECLEDALEYADEHGVRGGLSARARQNYRQRRNKVSA